MTFRILILGGTTEARQLASFLSRDKRFDATVSLAGRTKNPAPHEVPVRIGGFGGREGLATYLREGGIELLIDATHPFAANISANAAWAAAEYGVRLITIRRPQWQAKTGDHWRSHKDIGSAIEALGKLPRRVFVTLGRQELAPLATTPHHRYVVRSVDPIDPPLDLPDAVFLLARGPFQVDAEEALLRDHGIDVIVTKNSGGSASYAKLQAARRLGLPVEIVDRPNVEGEAVPTIDDALALLDHWVASAVNRGV